MSQAGFKSSQNLLHDSTESVWDVANDHQTTALE